MNAQIDLFSDGMEARVGIEPGVRVENTQAAGFSAVWMVRIFTIGRSLAQFSQNVTAFDEDRKIKSDASVIGEIQATRIIIEDGARFKGRIEIERGKASISN